MIFRGTWQFEASLDQFRFPGNYMAVGMPVLLTRDLDGDLRVFHNVCRHRAGVAARGAGNRKTLLRAFHGWLYGLEGCLRNAPEFEGVEGFDKHAFGLVPIRVEAWGPAAFVNMAPGGASLAEVLGNIPGETPTGDFGSMRRVERREYFINANARRHLEQPASRRLWPRDVLIEARERRPPLPGPGGRVSGAVIAPTVNWASSVAQEPYVCR